MPTVLPAEQTAYEYDASCRRRYLMLHRRTLRYGIDSHEVLESNVCHSILEGTTAFVTRDACEPTGVALGHPLPSATFSNRLWKLSRLVEHRLRRYGKSPGFAFVRPSTYHITVYNRSHFDRGAVFELSPSEKVKAARAVADARIGSIPIEFNGLLLSPEGRLLVRGFPQSDGLFRLRQRLAQELPTIDNTLPVLAHIKLGHFLVCPTLSQIREMSDWLGRCSYHINTRMVFTDAYTPAGLIQL